MTPQKGDFHILTEAEEALVRRRLARGDDPSSIRLPKSEPIKAIDLASGPSWTVLSIELPWPPRELWPNVGRKTHWAARGRVAKAYREQVYLIAHEVTTDLWMATKATLTVQAYHDHEGRRPDADGVLSAIKAGVDGMVDAGLFADDDHLTFIVKPSVLDTRKRIEVEIRW
jgi:Holliday junction resolvase RusA-like endonuclease